MRALRQVTGRVAVLDRADVDTDQIIPSDWLKRVERTGFGRGLFSEWRDDPEFVLNQPHFAGAKILVAGPRFGTGSSREHAVWALGEQSPGAIRGSSMQAVISAGGSRSSDFSTREIANFWLLHAVNSALAPLRHLLASRQRHHVVAMLQRRIQRGIRHQHRAPARLDQTRIQPCAHHRDAGAAQDVDDGHGFQFFTALRERDEDGFHCCSRCGQDGNMVRRFLFVGDRGLRGPAPLVAGRRGQLGSWLPFLSCQER